MINYYLLTKPGIVMGNLITVAAGFILGSQGHIDFLLFLATMIGLGLIMASACVFNNYIDRNIDKMMDRTKKRALVSGAISGPHALWFATFVGVIGAVVLYAYTNLLALAAALFGFFVYVVLYSLWKCRTVYGTAIGSVAGAVPPVVGYCAASGRFDTAAMILFAMMVFWQMPHFFSIALYHYEDYAKAGIPVLPISKGILRTKVHMMLYILGFIPIVLMLSFFDYTGTAFMTVATIAGVAWFILGVSGFNCTNDRLWGQQMFRLSLVIIGVICLAIPLDKV